MSENELIQCDMILRYLWESRNSNTLHIWREVYNNLKIETIDANNHLQYLMDRELIDTPTKGIGGNDGFEVDLTKKGRIFFGETNLIEEMKNKNKSSEGSITNNHFAGHFVSGNTGATINIDSHFNDAFNIIKSRHNEDSAQALALVKSMVEQSNNNENIELFMAFNEQLSKQKPNKTILKSLWEGLTLALPIITQTAGLVEKVLPLIS